MLAARFGSLELWLDPATDPRLIATALELLTRTPDDDPDDPDEDVT